MWDWPQYTEWNLNYFFTADDAISLIHDALEVFNRDVTCIKYVPKENEFDYVKFTNGSG